MKLLRQVIEVLAGWLDRVAGAIVAAIGWFGARGVVELVEGDNGAFTVRASGKGASAAALQIKEGGGLQASSGAPPNLKGSRVDIVLQPSRFMFRQLELP